MEDPSTWEKILLGITAMLVLLWFLPGIKAAGERSRQAEQRDWRGVLIPIGLVVLLVLLLISLVR
jgi:predicted small integral membrane protein